MTTTGTLLIKFDGDDTAEEVTVTLRPGGDLPMIDIGQQDYYVARDSEEAGEAVRQRWIDMKDNDKKEFRCLIGDERLIQWACDESDSFGISSFDEFLERVGDAPGEELASYDGEEREANINLPLAEELEWGGLDDAKLDMAALVSAIDDDIEIPDEIRAAQLNPDDVSPAAWAAILIASEGSESLDADGSIKDILNTFRFVSCVAYRHN